MRYFDESEREEKLRVRLMSLAITGLVGTLLVGTMWKVYASFTEDTQLEFSTEDFSKKNLLDLIRNKMQSIPFYLQKPGHTDTYQDVYMRLIEPYLDYFYAYMNDEQIDLLIDYIENKFPNYDYSTTDSGKCFQIFLDSTYKSDIKGYGIYKALMVETSGYSTDSYKKDRHFGGCYHFSILANLVGYEDLLPAIFEEDSKKMVDIICSKTSIERWKADRLIYVFDRYYANYDSDKELSEECIEEIKILIASMIQSKYDTDLEFRNGLFASALMDSNYFKEGEKLELFVVDYWNDSFCFVEDSQFYGSLWVNLPYYYLNSNMDIDTVIDSAALFVIRDGYTKSEWYETKSVELLSYIVPWNKIEYMANSNMTMYQRKQELYECLSGYFENEREFNEFVINLGMDHIGALDKFFSIWKSQMMSGPPTISKLLDLNSLHNRITSYTYLRSDLNPDSFERGSKEEDVFLFDLADYYFTCDYDYMKHFDEVRSYFHQQDSQFTELLSTESCSVCYQNRSWVSGERELSDTVIVPVLSKPLTLQRKEFDDGNFICYFVKPNNYLEGDFVQVFDNIENKRVDTIVPGVSVTLKNEETGEEEAVLIVSFNEEYSGKPVYYKFNYFDLYPKEYDQIIIHPRLIK